MDRKVDWLRVVACFMVVLLHVSGSNFHEFGPKWWGANFWDSLSRACVPVFFMISGATLLTKTETLTAFFRKRVSRIALPLVFWSVFYLWWLHHNGVHTGNWVIAILRGPTMYHLWYFYALIGLYLFMPVMRRFYQASNQSEKVFFLVVWFLAASVYPTLQGLYLDGQCSGSLRQGILADVYHLQYFGGYAGYMLLGAVLYERKGTLKEGVALFLCGSGGTFTSTYVLSRAVGAPCEFFYVYLTPFVVLAAAGMFIAFAQMSTSPPSKTLRVASDCTLGIYGLHPFVIDPFFLRYGLTQVTGSGWIDPLLTATGVFGVSFAVVYVGRQIISLNRIGRRSLPST